MIKHFLTHKKGITLLEGLIALGLLALVAGGTFSVLLSVSRKNAPASLQEEMLWAVDRARQSLHLYADRIGSEDGQISDQFLVNGQFNVYKLFRGLCYYGDASAVDTTPLKLNVEHNINCMLPLICDPDNSSFSYTVTNPGSLSLATNPSKKINQENFAAVTWPKRQVTFHIICNGYTL